KHQKGKVISPPVLEQYRHRTCKDRHDQEACNRGQGLAVAGQVRDPDQQRQSVSGRERSSRTYQPLEWPRSDLPESQWQLDPCPPDELRQVVPPHPEQKQGGRDCETQDEEPEEPGLLGPRDPP